MGRGGTRRGGSGGASLIGPLVGTRLAGTELNLAAHSSPKARGVGRRPASIQTGLEVEANLTHALFTVIIHTHTRLHNLLRSLPV